MFERFAEEARQVVVLAQDEARALEHNYIGTEHLLLGLIREEEGVAARVLASLRVTLGEARNRVRQLIGTGEEVRTGQIPFTPRAKKILELSLKESLSLRHEFIGTEHILLGLAREGEGVANQILLELGADSNAIRNAVFAELGAEPPSESWWTRRGPRVRRRRKT
jgi:ATP-dependent Clp protease ATP-binding subunit ClpC